MHQSQSQGSISVPGGGKPIGGIENHADSGAAQADDDWLNVAPPLPAGEDLTQAPANDARIGNPDNARTDDESLPHSLVTGSAMAASNAREEEMRQARVREEAYRIAQQRGFPAGEDMEHWLEAERRLAAPAEDPGHDSERH